MLGLLGHLGYVPLGGGKAKQLSLLKGGIPPAPGYATRRGDLRVVGSYHNDCGGCDGIKTQDEVCRRVLEYAKASQHVLFEGVIVGTIVGRYLNLSTQIEKLTGERMVWAFMDTPYELCLERVNRRNNGKAIKEGLMRSKYDLMVRMASKVGQEGERVEFVPHRQAVARLLDLMRLE